MPKRSQSFEEARRAWMRSVHKHPSPGDAVLKVAFALTDAFVDQLEFQKTKRLDASPSMAMLENETSMDRQRVSRGIEWLEHAGLMQVERPKSYGRGHRNRYILISKGVG